MPGHSERRLLARHRRVKQRHGGRAELAGLEEYILKASLEKSIAIASKTITLLVGVNDHITLDSHTSLVPLEVNCGLVCSVP